MYIFVNTIPGVAATGDTDCALAHGRVVPRVHAGLCGLHAAAMYLQYKLFECGHRAMLVHTQLFTQRSPRTPYPSATAQSEHAAPSRSFGGSR